MFMTQQGFWSMMGAWNSECELWVVNGRVKELPYTMPWGIQQKVFAVDQENQLHMSAIALFEGGT